MKWLGTVATKLRTAWSMFGLTLLMLFAVDGCLQRSLKNRENAQFRAYMDAYPDRDHSWVDEYTTEFIEHDAVDWHPYVYWRRHPFEGKYYGVDADGIRHTWNSPDAGDKAPRIFMFGGSTMWGTGVRPDYTLPSCVSRQLAAGGHKATITNFGEGGYVTTQELTTLMLELRKGNVPNVVVFYDGFNEVATAYQNGKAGLTSNEANRVSDFNADSRRSRIQKALTLLPGIGRFAAGLGKHTGKGYSLDAAAIPPLAADTVRVYRENIRMVRLLGKEYGFKTLFYWQPIIFKKDRLAPNEITAAANLAYMREFATTAYAALAADEELKKQDDFRDVSDVFRATEQGVYADFCHLSEEGNDLMARKIVDDVARALP